jgi:hypothetical protein
MKKRGAKKKTEDAKQNNCKQSLDSTNSDLKTRDQATTLQNSVTYTKVATYVYNRFQVPDPTSYSQVFVRYIEKQQKIAKKLLSEKELN